MLLFTFPSQTLIAIDHHLYRDGLADTSSQMEIFSETDAIERFQDVTHRLFRIRYDRDLSMPGMECLESVSRTLEIPLTC